MEIKLETVTSSSGSSFAAREKRMRRFRGTYHFHPEVELTAIVKGSGLRLIGDDLSAFTTGDLVLIGSNLPHRYVTDEHAKVVTHARVIQFAPDLLGEKFWQSVELGASRRMLQRASRGMTFPPSVCQQALTLILKLFQASHLQRLVHLLEVLDLLATSSGSRAIASNGYVCSAELHDATKLNRAIEHIHKHLTGPLTLTEISEVLQVSPATCNRLFNRLMGKSFKEFLVDVRISHACRLLVGSSDPVIEVAGKSGFRNLSNFNRLFKARQHESPRAYRKRLQLDSGRR